jgi:hypothetical protein
MIWQKGKGMPRALGQCQCIGPYRVSNGYCNSGCNIPVSPRAAYICAVWEGNSRVRQIGVSKLIHPFLPRAPRSWHADSHGLGRLSWRHSGPFRVRLGWGPPGGVLGSRENERNLVLGPRVALWAKAFATLSVPVRRTEYGVPLCGLCLTAVGKRDVPVSFVAWRPGVIFIFSTWKNLEFGFKLLKHVEFLVCILLTEYWKGVS